MIKYTQVQARRDFEIGYLTTWRIERAPIGSDGWIVVLGAGMSAGTLCETRSKETRVFKSLDGVISTLTSIGFEVNALFRGDHENY